MRSVVKFVTADCLVFLIRQTTMTKEKQYLRHGVMCLRFPGKGTLSTEFSNGGHAVKSSLGALACSRLSDSRVGKNRKGTRK